MAAKIYLRTRVQFGSKSRRRLGTSHYPGSFGGKRFHRTNSVIDVHFFKMLLSGKRGRKGKISPFEGAQNAGKYAQRLQMYKIPPTDNITLEEFEEFAIERLKVLRDVETFGIRYKRSSKEYQHAIKESLKKFLPQSEKPPSPEHLEAEEKERRKDHISHFILRLAYCRSEDLRRWFMSQEVELFRFRFVDVAQVYPSEADMFLKSNGLEYNSIKEEEREEKKSDLQESGYNLTIDKVLITDYYKVPFIEALDLVRSRKVYLEDGFAYVPREELVSLVANEFRMRLSRALAVTARALPYLEEDERLLPKLTNLSRQYVGQDYSNKKTTTGAKVTLDQVDGLSRSSFPLCMRQLHSALRENHHLKHGGRLQYGLFIKGIGLSLEEALIFWRMEFTKLMDVDKFEKQHAYNIRHNYGKEGKRQDYTPYSCMKIIMSNPPGPGDHHGCPFRHTDADLLRQRLAAYRVAKKGIDEIMEFVKDSHYQLACTRYYELTHGVSATSAINHPNQYFEESRQATQEGHGGTTRVGGATPSSLSHGRVAVKKEVTTTPDVDMSGDLGDFRMDDDDDEILGEIEGIEKVE